LLDEELELDVEEEAIKLSEEEEIEQNRILEE